MLLDIQSESNLSFADLENRFDLLVFGEIIEHLLNPGIALSNLLTISRLNQNSPVYITTPSAFFIGSFLPAVAAREIVHPEHYYYFSPRTLLRLLHDTGFQNVEMQLYSYPHTLAAPGLTKAGLIAICRPA
jgi:hypothetical protein